MNEELKNNTRTFLAKKTREYKKAGIIKYRRLVSAAVCLLFLLLGGRWLYFTPTATISIDINPSIELGINRFDRVISVNSYNDDGQDLADSLKIRFADYTSAVQQIMDNKDISALLSGDGVMTIVITGPTATAHMRKMWKKRMPWGSHMESIWHSWNCGHLTPISHRKIYRI